MSMTVLCRSNHGLLTMYEFGETVGGLDRCYYFGYGKDLYHFDHFMGDSFADLEVVYHLRALSCVTGKLHRAAIHRTLTLHAVNGMFVCRAISK